MSCNYTVVQVVLSYIHTIIHSYINTFTYAYTIYTPHHSYMVASVTQSLILAVSFQVSPHSSLCQAESSANEQLVIPMFIKSVIPSVSGQEMSLINHFKWQVPTNGQLAFTLCQAASPNQRKACIYLWLNCSFSNLTFPKVRFWPP